MNAAPSIGSNAVQCVLTFHGIGRPPKGIDEAELPYWIDWPMFDSIVGLATRRQSGPEIVFTFDDGNASDLTAAKKLGEAGISGRFFVLTGRIGETGYLSPGDLRRIRDLGMEIGLHGRDHVDWTRADDARLDAEIAGARKSLSDILGAPVRSVAVPFGRYDRRVMQRLGAEAFERIYTSDSGLSRKDQHRVPRNSVMAGQSLADVERIVADRGTPLRRLRRSVMPILKGLR